MVEDLGDVKLSLFLFGAHVMVTTWIHGAAQIVMAFYWVVDIHHPVRLSTHGQLRFSHLRFQSKSLMKNPDISFAFNIQLATLTWVYLS